jgi:hypothetical protein
MVGLFPKTAIQGVVMDGDADGEYPDFGNLDTGNWAYLGQFWFFPEIDGHGDGNYRVSVQHVEASSQGPSSTGWALSLDQELSGELGWLLRYGYGDGERKATRNLVSTGLVWTEAFGKNNDWLGSGVFWGDPSDPPGTPASLSRGTTDSMSDRRIQEMNTGWSCTGGRSSQSGLNSPRTSC